MDTIAIRNTVAQERQTARRRSFTGMEDHRVALSEAAALTHNFRATAEPDAVKGAYVGRGILEEILGQKEAVGIRIYNAKHEDGSPTFVLCGVAWDGDDLHSGVLAQQVWACPPWCPVKSPLNSDITVVLRFRGRRFMFDGNENHSVTIAQAAVYTRNFRDAAIQPDAGGVYMSRSILRGLLDQTGCVGIRMYYAKSDEGDAALVLVGVRADGSDIADGVIGKGIPDPPDEFCSPNPLNP